jgi:hypothetical protein
MTSVAMLSVSAWYGPQGEGSGIPSRYADVQVHADSPGFAVVSTNPPSLAVAESGNYVIMLKMGTPSYVSSGPIEFNYRVTPRSTAP